MASVLEYMLQGEVSPDNIVKWLKDEVCDQASERLKGLESLKQEFVPFFLNYLRDHTIHLLQSSKSATPSPAKVPSLQKRQKSASRKENGTKRQQLFGSSPAGDASEDIRELSSSVFSPNTSLDSPVVVNARGDFKNQRSNSKQRGNGQKKSPHNGNQWSPQCGSQKSYQAADQRSKQKLSLGEFFATPDRNNNGSSTWRKHTPNSGNRKDSLGDLSPSPNFGNGRRSGGRKKQSLSPLVQNDSRENYLYSTPKQVFSLNSSSDFPPMSADKQPCDQARDGHRLSSPVTNTGNSCDKTFPKRMNCDFNISRQIDFSTPDQDVLPDLSSDITKGKDIVSPETNSTGARRVTPTLIKVDKSLPQNSAFLAAEESNPSSTLSSKISCSGASVGGQKSIQHEFTRKENLSVETGTSTALVTPKKSALEHSTSQIDDVEASLGEVTHQDKLDILVSLYSKCLEDNLLPNVVVELYFLMQLLTARGGEEENKAKKRDRDVVEENYFSTVHNTVYFAVSVLELQKRLLAILDRATLRLLCENQRILVFSTALQVHLEGLFERSEVKRGPTYQRSPIGCVSFQADTDNKKSFPTEKCFHLFKKQRDGFYELIREWEASRMNPEYNMEEMFGGRVRTIISPSTHLANHIHFARLFQSQLLAMNKGEVSVPTPDEDENISLLSQLKRSNPAKFKRLQERFIKPLSLGGPCPPPAFPGCQEFFRDFIMTASNPVLNQHLSDTFAAKILEINEMCIGCHDDDDTGGGNEDDEGKELCCSMLLDLKLLAKFLGFVTFLPYQSPDRIPVAMEMDYIALRNKQVPPIDMYECIQVAGMSGYLMFTVPWVVEFLSMMDGMAARIDHYQRILYILLNIHRYTWAKLWEDLHYSHLITVCVISWLLENPVMPDGFFFMEIPEDVQRKVTDCLPSQTSVDSCSSVDQAIFYSCCPYIGEMKALLVDFAVGSSSKALSTRKITPVSTGASSDRPITDRQLQLQLEENFFHNHPSSLKRVVVFVADRTASNYIKKFRATQLHETFGAGKDRVRDLLMSQSDELPAGKLKERTSQVVNQVVQNVLMKVKATVRSDAPRYFEERISPLLLMLLPDDQCPVVVNMAVLISSRIAKEKVLNWINKHVTTALLKTEVSVDVEKICRTLVKNSEQGLGYHDELISQKIETQSKEKSMGHSTSLLNNRVNYKTDGKNTAQSADVKPVAQSGENEKETHKSVECSTSLPNGDCVNNKIDVKATAQSAFGKPVAQSIEINREVPVDTKKTETLSVVIEESVKEKIVRHSSCDRDDQSPGKNQRLGHVTATVHCDWLKHPSEVLLEFKDFVKGISLQNKQVTENNVLEQLAVVKETLEKRQDVIPSVHRSFVQLTVDLLIRLLVSQPAQYTPAVIDTCIQLWTTLLRDTTLRMVFSGRVVFLIQTSSDIELKRITECNHSDKYNHGIMGQEASGIFTHFFLDPGKCTAWQRYTDLLISLYRRDIVKVADVQEAALVLIQYIKDSDMLLRLCRCLCRFTEAIPAADRIEGFGECLEMLYNHLPSEQSKEAEAVLHALGMC